VRDNRPFGGTAPPAALYCYASRDRRGEHPVQRLERFAGILQADAYGGFNVLYDPGRQPKSITPAFCWSHARRPFFELADIAKNARRGRSATAISPIALEAVRRIDTLFDIERDINGLAAAERLAVRQDRSVPLLADLEAWLREQRAKLSRASAVIKPIDYAAIPQNRLHELLPWEWKRSTGCPQPQQPPEPEPVIAASHLARTRQPRGLPRMLTKEVGLGSVIRRPVAPIA
jgi:hypothetical protein